ncbi:MAG: hypothetical protein R3E87_04700 [Burkholderiaceae bacterium]
MSNACLPGCSPSARAWRVWQVIGGTALSIAPGEDVRYLLASLVVVIVGGMGSVTGAAIGALLIGVAENIGLAYFPTYGVVLTFVIMVVAPAFRPQGIMGQSSGVSPTRHRWPASPACIPATVVGYSAAARLPLDRLAVLCLSDRRLLADPGHGRAVADDAGRACGHGLAGLLSVAGVAGYTVAILSANNANIGPEWPWWLVAPLAT